MNVTVSFSDNLFNVVITDVSAASSLYIRCRGQSLIFNFKKASLKSLPREREGVFNRNSFSNRNNEAAVDKSRA